MGTRLANALQPVTNVLASFPQELCLNNLVVSMLIFMKLNTILNGAISRVYTKV